MSTVPTDPTTANVNIGLDIVLNCTARGAPEPTFAWFRGATELPGADPRVTITPGTTSGAAPDFVTVESTLTITGSLGTDAGAYFCMASNTVFTETRIDTMEFTLTINCEFSVCVCVMYIIAYVYACAHIRMCVHVCVCLCTLHIYWYMGTYVQPHSLGSTFQLFFTQNKKWEEGAWKIFSCEVCQLCGVCCMVFLNQISEHSDSHSNCFLFSDADDK